MGGPTFPPKRKDELTLNVNTIKCNAIKTYTDLQFTKEADSG